MRGWIAMVVVVLAASAAQGMQLPQLFDVEGVAANDVLNIRTAPSAASEIIGGLAPDARGIEVVRTNEAGTWGQINHGEVAAWVSMRYLAPRGVHIDNYNLPVGLSCFGTEPFWSLTPEDGAMEFTELGRSDDPVTLPLRIAQDSRVPEDLRRMVLMDGPEGQATAFIYPQTCSDGMSDRLFGLAIGFMPGPDATLYSGCCRLTR